MNHKFSEPKVHEVSRYSRVVRIIELSHFCLSSCLVCRYAMAVATVPCGFPQGLSAYSYWFFLLYCSVNSRSFLNFSTLSDFIFPAFIAFLLAFNQFKWSCSSIRCFDGFLWFSSRNPVTSLYLASHRSSCVISLSKCIVYISFSQERHTLYFLYGAGSSFSCLIPNAISFCTSLWSILCIWQ